MACANKIFSTSSGVRILSFFLRLFLIGAHYDFSHGNIFLMNRPLGFVFFCVRFFFVFGDLWCLDLWLSVDSDSYVHACFDFWSSKKGFQRVGCGGGNAIFC